MPGTVHQVFHADTITDIEHPHTRWCIKLVTGDRKQVNIQIVNIDR